MTRQINPQIDKNLDDTIDKLKTDLWTGDGLVVHALVPCLAGLASAVVLDLTKNKF